MTAAELVVSLSSFHHFMYFWTNKKDYTIQHQKRYKLLEVIKKKENKKKQAKKKSKFWLPISSSRLFISLWLEGNSVEIVDGE